MPYFDVGVFHHAVDTQVCVGDEFLLAGKLNGANAKRCQIENAATNSQL